MEYPKITFSPDSKDANQYAFFGDDDKPSNWFTFIDGNDEHLSEGYARRLCAAWNACEGIPTGDLEAGAKKDPTYWRMQSVRNAIDRNIATEENAALRAAVQEMARMLPVINEFEDHRPVTWDEVTNGTGVSTANAYRQTLENALAKMNEK